MNEQTITSTLRFEVVKPLGDRTWDELGAMLRALRAPLHRVMNHAISELELMRTAIKHQIPALHWDSMVKSRKPLGPNEHAHPQSVCYQLVARSWAHERQAAADRVASGKFYRGDDLIATTEPGAQTVNGCSSVVYSRWQKYDKERWKGESSLASFKTKPPIAVASSDAVQLDIVDGSFVLTLKLLAGQNGTIELVVRPYGGSGFADARRLVAGISAPNDAPIGIKLGDCRLVYLEPKRSGDHGSWQAMVSWTRPAAQSIGGGRVMALRRGIANFLVGAIGSTNEREARFWSETGADIRAHKLGYSARRRSLGRQTRQLGTGAHGHGEARRLEHVTRLEDAEQRYVQSKCREVAAHAIRNAQASAVSTILIEDWSTPGSDEMFIVQWPFAALKESIVWAAKRHGIEVKEVSTIYNARRCPLCKQLNESSERVFLCDNSACRLKRDREHVVAWNMLIDAQAEGPRHPHEDMKRATKRARGRLQKQQ